ncbi:TPA: hypothetical protein EYP84_00475, partial [Candidatus Bipolaricaulota bacterium]|nr:hypothetical protein [Candidatus Bipolaricaulota bacterium]
KRALVEFLRGRYKSIDEFNRVWNTRFASFDELRRTTAPPEPRMSNERVRQRAMSDQRDWVRLIAERYFAITTAAVRKYDPNHLILGCRFAGRAPFDIWDIAGRYCDIISVNIYPRIDLEREVVIGVEENLKKWYAIAKKPFMITEWSFPALDSGLPCTHGAGMRVDTQEQRAKCFEIMQMLLFRLPFMVGSDYFMWVDEPALGISSTFPENTNYGLVNERDEPYELLTTACKRLNARVCEIHAGRLPNISVRVSSTGKRIAVRNTGKSTVRVVIAMRVDGSEMRQLVEIKPDKTRRLSVPMPRTPGGHVVECIADPTKLLAEPDRTDNYDYKVVYISGAPWAREAKDANVRIPIVIFNRSNRRLKNAPITVQLCELNRKLRWAQFKRSSCTVMVNSNGRQRRASFALLPATNGDACSPMDELTIVIPHLRQHGVCTAWLYLSKQPMSSASARGSSKLAIKIDAQRRSFILDNGRLRLIKNEPDGDAIDRVELRKPDGSWLALGKLTPLIWQYVGQDMWVAPNELESIHVAVATDTLVALDLTFVRHGASQGEVRTVVDERGEYAPVEQRPRAF